MADESSEHIRITGRLEIPAPELEFRFSRSGGPGGQNVNRRETRVELLFDVHSSPSLSERQRNRLLKRLASQIDRDGVLHIVARTHRSQLRNRQEAIERFVELLQRGLRAPRRRLPTRVPPRAIKRRLAGKRRRGEIKKLRKRVQPDDSG
jgi:ribosome-associated protein